MFSIPTSDISCSAIYLLTEMIIRVWYWFMAIWIGLCNLPDAIWLAHAYYDDAIDEK